MTALEAPSGATTPRGIGRPEVPRGFRPDIEGLRAVAVLMVLVYHGNPAALPGGFVGVDVFFVISGFLISGLLLAEHQRTGTISLRAFYARRARRLLPAAALVLLTVAVGALLLLPRTRFAALAQDITASALYGMNWLLANRAVSYQALNAAPSPLQHFWSLGVEEQFYLLWPVLILGAAALARRRRWRLRAGLAIAFAAAAVLSFMASVVLAALDPERAYFVTQTRIWELALGGLLAVFASSERVRSRRWPAAGVAGWAGLGAIGAAAILFSGSSVFPGWLALLPTVGAVLVIGGGSLRGPPGPRVLLSLQPLQVLGTLSYSLYLWHWPMLVFARHQWPGMGGALGILISAASVLPAYLTYRLVEKPVHTSPRVAARAWRGLAVGLACTLVGVMAGNAVQASIGTTSRQALRSDVRPDVRSDVRPGVRPGRGAPPLVAGGLGDERAAIPIVDHFASIDPDPVVAVDDRPAAQNNGCQVGTQDSTAHSCTYGDQASRTTIALVGDSHATQILPALELAAAARHWRIVTYLKGACPLAAVTVTLRDLPFTSCSTWNSNVQAALVSGQRPALVITTSSHYEVSGNEVSGDGRVLSEAGKKAALVTGLRTSWGRLTAAGMKVAVLADTPVPRLDIPECVAEHPDQLSRCAIPKTTAVPADAPNLTAAAGDPAVSLVDLNDGICPGPRCAAVIGGVLVYRDDSHLTATYVKTLAPRLERALAPLVGRPADSSHG